MSDQDTDPRFLQASREAKLCLLLAALNFLWWYAFAYGLGSGPVEEYTWIWGLPAWFFFSCLLGLPLFLLLIHLLVRIFFREVPLEGYLEEQQTDHQSRE
ncbi:MAG: YhdT family protein [Desulfohalobiaceae bacterium]